ncbi:MAG: hypothetical protein AAFV27_04245 [Pseudomonadota bacterium]
MPAPRILLEFGGLAPELRAHLKTQVDLAHQLEVRPRMRCDHLGSDASEILPELASNIRNGIIKDESPVDTTAGGGEQDKVETYIAAAAELVDKAAANEARAQTEAQARATKEYLDRFKGALPLFHTCTCPVCSNGADAYGEDQSYSFHADGRATVPLCLRRLARDVEMARVFVEALYGDYLEGKRIVARVHFDNPLRAAPTVNGTTGRSSATTPWFGGTDISRRVDIALMLPMRLDTERTLSVLYVAAHEIGIHAVQQLARGNPFPRNETNTTFGEGLVEAAIFDSLNAVLRAERGHYVDVDAYVAPVENRHKVHAETPYSVGSTPGEIKHGQDLFNRLVALGTAAFTSKVGLRLCRGKDDEVDPTQLRALRRLPFKRSGRDWARRLVLALNLLDLNGKMRDETIWWLEDSLNKKYRDFDQFFATFQSQPPRGFPQFFRVLNGLVRDPYDEAVRQKLIKAVMERTEHR